MKLGKLPATSDPRDLQYAAIRTGKLPPRPPRFGHTSLPSKRPWKMLANDQYGCCVFSSAAHMVMLWNELAGRRVEFNDECVLSDYSAVTGFDPNNPDTDRGTNMRQMLNYWRKVGIVDATGVRHRIGAFVAIEPGNWDHMMEALFLFDAVNLGIVVTKDAESRFDRNDIWDLPRSGHSEEVGGHCYPLVSQYNFTNGVTWGRSQGATKRFITFQTDESYAIVSEEALHNGKSEDGYDRAALLQYLNAVKI